MGEIIGKKVPMKYFLQLLLLFNFSGYLYAAEGNGNGTEYIPCGSNNPNIPVLLPIVRNTLGEDCQWYEIGPTNTFSLRNFKFQLIGWIISMLNALLEKCKSFLWRDDLPSFYMWRSKWSLRL